jgi:hypothetical protein
LEVYEHAKIIKITNIFGDYSKSASVPVYEKPKVVAGNRYYVCGKEVLVD